MFFFWCEKSVADLKLQTVIFTPFLLCYLSDQWHSQDFEPGGTAPVLTKSGRNHNFLHKYNKHRPVRPTRYAPPVCNPDLCPFDRLTLKLVCESHLMWGTLIPNFGMLGLRVLE